MAKTHPRGRILDAGGTRDSVFLPGLARLGFRSLLNFNLDEPRPETIGDVSYACADITRTGASDQSFDFIACLSVLEHGVASSSKRAAYGCAFLLAICQLESPNGSGNPSSAITSVSVRAGGGKSRVSARRAGMPDDMELGARVSDGWSPGGSVKVVLRYASPSRPRTR